MTRVETINLNCPECSKPIQIVWCVGVVPDPYSVLIADAVICSECWDDMVNSYNWEAHDEG